ncbi:response regulator, partial [Nostoc sp. NIES-2111]
MRVLLVDDNELWRASLVRALGDRGATVAVEAGSPQELDARLGGIELADIDVAVLDLRLPPTWSDEGIHLARRLRHAAPAIAIIILSGYEQDVQLYYATRALEDLEAGGGIGYLTKDR